MNRQKGIYRAILVVSIIAFILGFVLYVKYVANYYMTDMEILGFALLTGSVCFAVVWVSFFAVLWIIKGFHEDEKK